MAEFRRLAGLAADWDWSRCAVIAREWRYLAPVRAFCEAHGIPVQMGNEEFPRFWHLRETRALVEWVRRRDSRLVDAAALHAWAGTRPSDRWHDLLRQAIEEHALETGGTETAADHFIEWLAEWSREIRRRPRGLLLATAHRTKGLEFEHVAVLDGGWNRIGEDEDADAPRRLYYVAMTRAQRTLALARFDGPHPLQEPLRGNPSVLHRRPAELPADLAALDRRYVQPGFEDVDIGFAGRRGARHAVHRAIAALSTGDPLDVRIAPGGRWEMRDPDGRRGRAPCRALRAASGHALPFRIRLCRRRLEPRRLAAGIPRQHELRDLGGGAARARVRADAVAKPDRPSPVPRRPSVSANPRGGV